MPRESAGMSKTTLALILVVLAGLLTAGGYRWGSTAKENEWQARQAQAERQAHEDFRIEERRSFKASEEHQAAQQQLAGNYQQLEKAFNDYRKRKAPLTRSPARPAAATTPSPADPTACVIVVDPEPVPVQLSHGAVWMWNSALTGTDATSGACGLADQSVEACSVDAEVTLDDAWDNHTTNAKTCAADRLRHQHLIDFVKGKRNE